MTIDDRSYTERFKTPKPGEYKFNKVPLDDPRVYALIGKGRTQGCFQIESKLGKDWASAIKPNNLKEISDLIALIRPGCLESGMTETYKDVKKQVKEIEFYHPSLEPILKDTKGVLVYQEQILEIAKKIAGFSETEADELRRCITQDTYFISKTRGWITVKRLLKEGYKKDLFLTMDEYGNHHWDEIDEIWSTGSKATHLVETETGLSITTSLYHQFMTNNGWKCKRRLDEKDWLVVSDIVPYDGEDRISSNMAYIIACLLTEGYFPRSNSRAHFCNWDKDFMDKYIKAYTAELGESPKISNDGKYAYVPKKHKDIIKKILTTGLSRNKFIPDVMMGMTLETTRRFLSAMLYAEGSVAYSDNGSTFGFSSASLKMAKQVKMLMMRFGIRSIIESKWNKKYNQYYYNVSVTPKYDQEILLRELTSEWSQEKIERFRKCVERKTTIGSSNMRRIPRNIVNKIINQYPYTVNYEGGSAYVEDMSWDRFSRIANRSKDKKWIRFADESKHSYEKITTIVKDSNSRKVYDFRMKNEDRPQIIANGILIHNCVGKKDAEKMIQMKDVFVKKAEQKGTITKEEAEEIFSWIQKSARYSFNACKSSKEKILRYSSNTEESGLTIGELYKIKNDPECTNDAKYSDLSKKYKNQENYGIAMSMCKDGIIRPNIIKDIRYEGKQEVFRVKLENGAITECTDNHKFPTPHGKKQLKYISVGDELYVKTESMINDGYETKLVKIASIESVGVEDVYDVEMEAPNHNFVVESGIVTCNSHSVSYGMTTYYTTYAKVHYPTEFFCAYLMFSDLKPDPKEEIYILVNDARSFGVNITTPKLHLMNRNFTISKDKEIAFGLKHIRDVGDSAIDKIVALGDKIKTPVGFLSNIVEIGRRTAESLVKSGACDEWGIERTSLLKFINVIYGYSSKEADKKLELRQLSKKEMDFFLENFKEIDENLIDSLKNILEKIIAEKACMSKREHVIRDKIAQCTNCGKDTNLLKSAWEKVYLGINLSCSAADDIVANDGMTCKQVFDYEPEDFRKEKFKMYCTIDKVHHKITSEKAKNPGQEYCYIDASDSTLALEGIVCWSEQFEKFKDFINEGALVCITGKWSRYKDRKQFTLLEIQEIHL